MLTPSDVLLQTPEIRIWTCHEPTTLAATAFLDAQLAALAPQLDARYSGTWFDPLRSGEGLQFEFSQFADGQRVAIVTWYTYDLAGQPIYLGGSSTYEAGATRVTVPLVSTSGTMFGTGFNAASVQRLAWGEVNLEFPDCSNSRVTYQGINPGFGSGELRLSRIAAPPPHRGTPVLLRSIVVQHALPGVVADSYARSSSPSAAGF